MSYCMHGQDTVVPMRLITFIPSDSGANATSKKEYGTAPWNMENAQSVSAYDNWLLYQARSFLGYDCALADAFALWDRLDINTRQPKQAPQPRSAPLSWLLRLTGSAE